MKLTAQVANWSEACGYLTRRSPVPRRVSGGALRRHTAVQRSLMGLIPQTAAVLGTLSPEIRRPNLHENMPS